MIEKVAYKGQQSARLGIVMQLYIQQSLGNLVEHFQSDNFSKDEGLEQVKNVFSMTTKCLDQIGRAGAFHHIIRRTAAMSDTALYELDDALEFSNLSLSGEGVFGSGLENLLKTRKEKTKPLEDLVPEVKRKNFKRKSESQVRSVVDIINGHTLTRHLCRVRHTKTIQNQRNGTVFVSQDYHVNRGLKLSKNPGDMLKDSMVIDRATEILKIQIGPLDRWRHRRHTNMSSTIPNSHENSSFSSKSVSEIIFSDTVQLQPVVSKQSTDNPKSLA